MNRDSDYYDGDMSDDEYAYRQRAEEESRNYYANIKKTETKRKSDDDIAYRFSDDDDDMYSSY